MQGGSATVTQQNEAGATGVVGSLSEGDYFGAWGVCLASYVIGLMSLSLYLL